MLFQKSPVVMEFKGTVMFPVSHMGFIYDGVSLADFEL